MSSKGALCKRCNHFPVHAPKTQGVQAVHQLCLHAHMRIDCSRWRLWDRWMDARSLERLQATLDRGTR